MLPLKKNRMRIGGWWSTDPDLISDEYVKILSESGCNFIMTSQLEDTDKIKELLSYCDKYDVECIVYDTRIYDNEQAEIGEITKNYCNYESYVGNLIKDEPGVEQYPHVRRLYDKFIAQTPGKKPYINLLPMYASAAQLKYGADVQAIDYYDTPNTTYGEHLDKYCQDFDTPYICVDVYPCRTEGDGITRSIYPGYLENLSQMAHYCRKYNRDFWVMVQTLIWYPGATVPTETDLRWQFNTVLSFGAKAFFHYCYACPPGHTPGLIDKEGRPSDLYYPAQRIHKALTAIEDIYYTYKNIGAFNVNSSQEFSYLNFEEQCTSFNIIEEVVSDDQLLIGCFEKDDGSAFTIVNMTQIKDNKTAHAKLKIKGEKVTAHIDGIPYNVAPINGYYEFVMPCGEGYFVTVE